MDKYDIDYVAKMDTNTLLHLDNYFAFAKTTLRQHDPSQSNNRRTLVGSFADILRYAK